MGYELIHVLTGSACGVFAVKSKALQAQTKRTLLERAYGSAFPMKMDIERQILSRYEIAFSSLSHLQEKRH